MSIATDIKRIVEKAYAEASTGSSVTELIRRRVAEYMSRQAVKGEARKDLEREVRRQVRGYLTDRDKKKGKEFDARYGTKVEQQKRISRELSAEVARAEAGMQRAQSKILPSIQRAIEQAARTGKDPVEIARKAARRAKRADAAVQAEIATAKASIDRIMRMKGAVDAGYEFFRYTGPTVNVRPFCGQRINGVFHITEIRTLNNGQGLPVESHCGGYHCRHRWAPVTNKIARWKEDLAEDIDLSMDPDFDAFFGGIKGRRLVEAFDLGMPSVGMRLNNISGTSHDAEIEFGLLDVSGKTIGKLKRSFEYYNGIYTVNHDYFRIDRGFQTRGGALNVFRNSLEFYDEVGADRIKVHAALDGGHHVWARFGFDFAKQGERNLWADELAWYISTQTGVARTIADQAVARLETPLDFIDFRADFNGKSVDGLTWKRTVFKKDWWGELDLSRNSRSRRKLENYLAKAKK